MTAPSSASSAEAVCMCRCRADKHRAQFPDVLLTGDAQIVEGWLVECTTPGCPCLQYVEQVGGRR